MVEGREFSMTDRADDDAVRSDEDQRRVSQAGNGAIAAEGAEGAVDATVAAIGPRLGAPTTQRRDVVLVTGPWLAGVSGVVTALNVRRVGRPGGGRSSYGGGVRRFGGGRIDRVRLRAA
jgi:hypothetical protein